MNGQYCRANRRPLVGLRDPLSALQIRAVDTVEVPLRWHNPQSVAFPK